MVPAQEHEIIIVFAIDYGFECIIELMIMVFMHKDHNGMCKAKRERKGLAATCHKFFQAKRSKSFVAR